jgi:hypothetical protein
LNEKKIGFCFICVSVTPVSVTCAVQPIVIGLHFYKLNSCFVFIFCYLFTVIRNKKQAQCTNQLISQCMLVKFGIHSGAFQFPNSGIDGSKGNSNANNKPQCVSTEITNNQQLYSLIHYLRYLASYCYRTFES